MIGALLQTLPPVVPGNGKAIPRSGRTESVSVSSASGCSKISLVLVSLQPLIRPAQSGIGGYKTLSQVCFQAAVPVQDLRGSLPTHPLFDFVSDSVCKKTKVQGYKKSVLYF